MLCKRYECNVYDLDSALCNGCYLNPLNDIVIKLQNRNDYNTFDYLKDLKELKNYIVINNDKNNTLDLLDYALNNNLVLFIDYLNLKAFINKINA